MEHFGPKFAQMIQMVSFGTILDHLGPKAAQMFQMDSFVTILHNFAPKAAQMLQTETNGRPTASEGLFGESWKSQSHRRGWWKMIGRPLGRGF